MFFSRRKPTWLKFIIIFAVLSILSSYVCFINSHIKKTEEIQYIPKIEPKTGITIRKLSDEVSPGLHEIKIDDTTTILLYSGVKSCTMIKK